MVKFCNWKKKTDYINLTKKEVTLFEKIRNKRSLSKHLYLRINIVLLANSNKSVAEIQRETRVSFQTVHRWIDYWIESYPMLVEARKGVDDKGIKDIKYTEMMLSVLEDSERSGAPPRITKAEIDLIQALACSDPIEKGYPITHWTHVELAKAAVEQKILDRISPTHIGRILKKQITAP